MKTSNKLIVTAVLLITLPLSNTVFASAKHEQKQVRHLLSKLELSQTQRQDLKQIFKQSKEDKKLYQQDMKRFAHEMKALTHSSQWDEQSAKELLTQQSQIRSQLGLLKAQQQHDMWHALRAEQQTKLSMLMEKHSERAAKKGKDKKRRKTWLDQVELNAEQEAKILAIKSEMKASADLHKASKKAFKEERESLIRAQTFDTGAWQALQNKYQASFFDMALAKAASKNSMWNVLSLEQKAKLEDAREARQQKRLLKKDKKERKNKVRQQESV